MRLQLNSAARRKSISLTPLIDVVFILLLFFMLTSSFLHERQIDVSAATESSLQERVNVEQIINLLNNDGEFRLNQRVYSIHDLSQIEAIVSQNKKTVFVIEAANGVNTQSIVSILDVFKKAGAVSVTLAGIE